MQASEPPIHVRLTLDELAPWLPLSRRERALLTDLVPIAMKRAVQADRVRVVKKLATMLTIPKPVEVTE